VDGVGDEFLADAGLAADEHGGVGGGDLRDEVEGGLHGAGTANHVCRAEFCLQLVLEAGILLEQAVTLLLVFLAQADGVGDHRGDDGHQAHVFVGDHVLGEEAISAQRADDLAFQLDRDADVGDFVLVQVLAGAGAVEEQGFLRNFRDDHGPTGLYHLPDDALARAVAAALEFLVAQAVRGLDIEVSGLTIDQGNRAAEHASVPGNRLEHRPQLVTKIQAPVEDLADLEEEREVRDCALDLLIGRLICFHWPRQPTFLSVLSPRTYTSVGKTGRYCQFAQNTPYPVQ
jgi:hypothetical protein